MAPPRAPPKNVRPAPVNSEPSRSSFASDQFSTTHQSRAPAIPPTAAKKMNSHAQSRGLPISSR
jgi:hypothetical protein